MSNDTATNKSLKDEGNALFSQKDFGGAYLIYTAAIEQDKSSPVLYANRAACLLPLKRYMPILHRRDCAYITGIGSLKLARTARRYGNVG